MNYKDIFDDQNMMRELLLDHYQNPHNHGLVEDSKYLSKHMASASCIDDITIQLDVEDNIIKDIRFDGVACTISTASTSMMSDLLIGKIIIQKNFNSFLLMQYLNKYYYIIQNLLTLNQLLIPIKMLEIRIQYLDLKMEVLILLVFVLQKQIL